jgi:hypothetical protein
LARLENPREGIAMTNHHVDFPSDVSPIFWGEISPCEHIAQFYDTDAVFLDTLAGFIGGGLIAATIRLERLWHEICKSQNFSLLCAYPKTGCTEDASESIAEICAAHTRVI